MEMFRSGLLCSGKLLKLQQVPFIGKNRLRIKIDYLVIIRLLVTDMLVYLHRQVIV